MTTPATTPATRAAPLGAYRTPGVRLEWLDAAPQSRGLVRTDIAGFAGIAMRGPLGRPVRVDSWEGFRGVFGEHLPEAYLAYAVEGFFAGGGDRCWVVRAADPATAAPASVTLPGAAGPVALTLTASSPGVWGRRVGYRVDAVPGGRFTLTLRFGEVTEVWRDLGPGRPPADLLNDPSTGSRLAQVPAFHGPPAAAAGFLDGGSDGLETLTTEHFSAALGELDRVAEVALVAAPDLWARPVPAPAKPRPRKPRCEVLTGTADPAPPTPPPARRPDFDVEEIALLQQDVLARCERLGDRVALLDAPPGATPVAALDWRRRFDSPFGALYHPWLLVVDPLSATGDVAAVPPAGHVAGVCAHVDLTAGVHEPPANELVPLAVDTVSTVDEVTHGDLNDGGVNAIRPVRGMRVLGDRTLARALPEWQYLNVRRLVLAIEEEIVEETAWTVFEPNGPRLWREVDRVVRGVLEQAWQRGMLRGASREEAYSVTCDATVNPPADVAAGRLVCLIGLNPPPPAEFVVVRVIRTPSGVAVREGAGDG
ncbi:phage tail sheath C-terminal domain-containing protein [Amycolatopsis sp. NPDC021455]|uniref:phage tail sheath family protein n=1 Tax=Amycolatopsis sp. NPDC021455 TaxID=3154901 RepID=UPI0033CCA7C9